jgi:hypothetical protein
MTVFGTVLVRFRKLEDGTPQIIPSADTLPPPYVRNPSSLSRFFQRSLADDASLTFSPRASLFLGASQHLRGKRAEELGWQPRPVVLEEWADEGITSALAKLTPLQN